MLFSLPEFRELQTMFNFFCFRSGFGSVLINPSFLKDDRTFAILHVTLPSKCTGGTIRLNHDSINVDDGLTHASDTYNIAGLVQRCYI